MNAGAGGRVRLAVLGAAALLAAAGAVAWKHEAGRSNAKTGLPEPAGRVFVARVGLLPPSRTDLDVCGVRLGPKTKGIRHAQLPCGVKLYITYGGTTVLTQVVDQGATSTDDFELTPALADLLGINHRATVRWRFAR